MDSLPVTDVINVKEEFVIPKMENDTNSENDFVVRNEIKKENEIKIENEIMLEYNAGLEIETESESETGSSNKTELEDIIIQNRNKRFDNLAEFCQACLTTNSKNLKDMTKKHLYNDRLEIYSEMLEYCFGLQLEKRGVENIYLICEACISRLREVFEFKIQVEKAQRNIRKSKDKAMRVAGMCSNIVDSTSPEFVDVPNFPQTQKEVDINMYYNVNSKIISREIAENISRIHFKVVDNVPILTDTQDDAAYDNTIDYNLDENPDTSANTSEIIPDNSPHIEHSQEEMNDEFYCRVGTSMENNVFIGNNMDNCNRTSDVASVIPSLHELHDENLMRNKKRISRPSEWKRNKIRKAIQQEVAAILPTPCLDLQMTVNSELAITDKTTSLISRQHENVYSSFVDDECPDKHFIDQSPILPASTQETEIQNAKRIKKSYLKVKRATPAVGANDEDPPSEPDVDQIQADVAESERRESRKRLRCPDTWKRNVLCIERYSSKKIPEFPQCNHDTRQFKCSSLSESDVQNFHAAFYQNKKKLAQDTFLVKYCKGFTVASHKKAIRKKTLNIKYFVRINQIDKTVPVCQKTFMGILNLKKSRIQGVVKRFHSGAGKLPVERRGGNKANASFIKKKASVVAFLKSLKESEPHDCQSKTKRRIYLSSDLNVVKLWGMYNNKSSTELQVKEKYFRDIFNRDFNFSFETPATDECSTCSEFLKTQTDY